MLPAMSPCGASHAITPRDLRAFEGLDAQFPGRNSVVQADMIALDGSSCKPSTVEGVAQVSGDDAVPKCVDLGIKNIEKGGSSGGIVL